MRHSSDHQSAAPPRIPDAARIVPIPTAAPPPQSQTLRDALIAASWTAPPRCAKRDGDAATWLGDLVLQSASLPVVLKRIPLRRGAAGFIQRLLRRTRAERQSRGAALLTRANIPCSRPILLLRTPSHDHLLCERIPGPDALHTLHPDSPTRPVAEQHAIAARNGKSVRALADAGLVNRDHKLSNIILCAGADIALVDTVAITPSRHRDNAIHRMLAAMLFESVGVELLPRRALRMRTLTAAVGRDGARAEWRRLAETLRAAGDTTPKINPLHDLPR
ncbi:MAG: hypothetical protein VYC34_05295 [Planctomycetota bacterium]|nr:hypothetical protein [Planctomycetota bacterium]